MSKENTNTQAAAELAPETWMPSETACIIENATDNLSFAEADLTQLQSHWATVPEHMRTATLAAIVKGIKLIIKVAVDVPSDEKSQRDIIEELKGAIEAEEASL